MCSFEREFSLPCQAAAREPAAGRAEPLTEPSSPEVAWGLDPTRPRQGLPMRDKMNRGRVAIAVICAGIVLTVVVWAVLAVLAGKLIV